VQADLDRLLESLEALRYGREWNAETAVLALVPGRADPELGRPLDRTSSVVTILARSPGWR